MGARSSLDDLSIEMADFEVRKIRKFDRIWRIGPGGSISSGALASDGKIFFGSRNHFFYAIDARTGKEAWKFKASGMVGGSTPVISGGRLYFGAHDNILYCLDAGTGRNLWKFQTQGAIVAGSCIDGSRIYFGSSDFCVYSLDLKTGVLAWKFRTNDRIASVPGVWDGSVFIGSFDRNFYCLDKETGRMAWKFPTQGEIFNFTPLLIHGGRVYFTSFDNYLRAADALTGKLIWKFRTGSYGISSGTVLHRGLLLQACRDGCLYALDMEGRAIWRYSTNHMMLAVVCGGDRIYCSSEDHCLHCLDMEGRLLWKFRTQGMLIGLPCIYGDAVYFGSYDCYLYAVDAATGELVWKFGVGGQPCYTPPPNEYFEVFLKAPREESAGLGMGGYEIRMSVPEAPERSLYQPRVAYQVSARYREKGKYQSSDDEDF